MCPRVQEKCQPRDDAGYDEDGYDIRWSQDDMDNNTDFRAQGMWKGQMTETTKLRSGMVVSNWAIT